MSALQTPYPTDTWVAAPWNDYLMAMANPAYQGAKGYYYHGHLKLEMLPVSFDHGQNHVVLISNRHEA